LVKVLPDSWQDLARPFAIAIAVLVTFVVGSALSDVLGLRTQFIVFVFFWLPILVLIGISDVWLWRAFHAEADRRGWAGRKRRNERLSFLMLGPLYLWSLRDESSDRPHA
jgi:hypothetical protein